VTGALASLPTARSARQQHAPALLLLALFSARTALGEPAKFEAEIQAYEKQDRIAPPAPGGFLFVGSSTIRLWQTADAFPGLPVTNRGFGGSTVADSVAFADRIILPYKPRLIVFFAGTNDLAEGKSPAQVLADVKTLVTKVHGALPRTRFLFMSPFSTLKRWQLDEQMRAYHAMLAAFILGDARLGLLDLAPDMRDGVGRPLAQLLRADGLHMSVDGYRLWNRRLRPLLSRP
jgi:lysophospholipase L1-like esterase